MNPYYTSFFRRGDKVYIREVTEDGGRRNYNVEYKPKLYFPTSEPNCSYVTLDKEPLKEVQFSSIKNAKEYVSAYGGKVYGFNRWEYACINELYPHDIEYNISDIRVVYLDIETWTEGHYSTVSNPDQPIILIQLLYNNTIYIFGTEYYESYEDNIKFIRCKNEEDLLKKFVTIFRKIDPDIVSDWNGSGYDLPMLYARMELLDMSAIFKKLSPFNMIEVYEDIVFGKPQLRVDIKGIQHLDYMNMVRKFDNRRYINYKLNTVAKTLLKREKVKYEGTMHQLYLLNYSKFVEYGITDVDLLKGINQETNLLELLVMLGYKSKTNFEDAFYQVRMWDCTFYDYLKNHKGVQVPFKAYEGKEAIEDNYDDDEDGYEGAYVKPVKAGKYKWIMSDDVQSLYPSIMMAWNMSPETYVGKTNLDVEYFVNLDDVSFTRDLVEKNHACVANGARFTRDFIGFIPEIINAEFNARVEAKNKMTQAKKRIEELEKSGSYDSTEMTHLKNVASVEKIKQLALKVRINSAYGAIGNPHFRFYMREIAEGITLTGQVLLKRVDRDVNKLLNSICGTSGIDYVVAQDTDSNYMVLEKLVNKFVPPNTSLADTVEFLDRYHKKNIAPVIAKITNDMQSDMNAYEKRLKFVRDVIADVGIFLAKKRYVLQVWDAEGVRYTKPDMKVMGIESVKSSTPQYCQTKINESISIMLNKDENGLIDFITQTRAEFMNLPVEAIASPRGISDLDKWVEQSKVNGAIFSHDDDTKEHITSKTSTPYHVKGAINYNNYIKKCGVDNLYFPITNGDKIKFVYLKTPNPSKFNTIAFDEELPKEFDLHKYVDMDIQYHKTLFAPIHAIATAIGWKTEKNNGAFF